MITSQWEYSFFFSDYKQYYICGNVIDSYDFE